MAELNEALVKKISDAIVKLNNDLITMDATYSKMLTSIEKGNQTFTKKAATTKILSEAERLLKEEAEKLTKAERESERAAAQLDKQRQKGLAAMAKAEAKERELIAALNMEVKSEGDLIKKTNAMVAVRRRLDKTTISGAKYHKQLTAEINRNTNSLKAQDAQIGRSQRNVGNYGSALKGIGSQFLGALGLTSLVFGFVNVLKNGISTIKNFGKENAVLAGVLNLETEQIKALTNNARELGGTYPTLASDVTKLQVSYARLGFTQNEILALTKDTIEGSLALNSELGDTATLVGAIIRSFDNLAATNAKEIIDKLTISTQKTSLSFEKLETSIPKVAGAANALGIGLSPMLAQLGIAQDATQDASIAGTSLRNIYLELAKRGLTLAEGMEIINGSTNKLVTSYDLFGKRAAITALALANNVGKLGELETAIDDSGGTAERVAKTQMDTFAGAVDGMKSSWERFILGLKKSEGIFKFVISGVTLLIDGLADLGKSPYQIVLESNVDAILKANSKTIKEAISKDKKVLNTLIEKYVETGLTQEKAEEKAVNAFLIQLNKRKGVGNKFSDERITAIQKEFKTIDKLSNDQLKQQVKYLENLYDIQISLGLKKEAEITAQQLKEFNKRVTQKTLIEQTAELELIEAADIANKAKIKAEETLQKELIELKKSSGIFSNDELFNLDKEALENSAAFALLAEEEKLLALKNLRKKYYKDIEKLDSKSIEQQKENSLDLLKQHGEVLAAEVRKTEEKTIESAQKRAAEVAFITDALGMVVGGIADGLFDKGAMQRDEEINAIRSNADAEIAEIERKNKAGELSDAQAAIEKDKINKKEANQIAAIKTKQAKADKKQAMFNIILSTAEGVAKVWGQTGIFGLAAQIPVIIMGALRLGIAAAQPIPKFKEGTKGKHSTPDTFITSEPGAGIEAVEKNNRLIFTDKPTLHTGMSGARVYSNPEVKALTRGYSPKNQNELNQLAMSIQNSGDKTVSAIQNIKTFIVDENRQIYGFKQGNYRRNYL